MATIQHAGVGPINCPALVCVALLDGEPKKKKEIVFCETFVLVFQLNHVLNLFFSYMT